MKQHLVLTPHFFSGDFRVSAVHLCLYTSPNHVTYNNHYMKADHGIKTFGNILMICDKMIKISFRFIILE